MSAKRPDKAFDCLAYKDKAQQEIVDAIRDLTPQEQIDYLNRRAATGRLANWWKRLRRTPAGTATSDD